MYVCIYICICIYNILNDSINHGTPGSPMDQDPQGPQGPQGPQAELWMPMTETTKSSRWY